MERSEIRDCSSYNLQAPDCAPLHPGYGLICAGASLRTSQSEKHQNSAIETQQVVIV